MDTFKLVTLIAGFVSVLLAIFDSVFPSEKYNKQLRLLFSMVFILCIVAPIKSSIGELTSFSDYIEVSSEKLEVQSDISEDFFVQSVENNINRNIEASLNEKDIHPYEIKTSINISQSGSISINEIEIAVSDTAQEGEIIDVVNNLTGGNVNIIINPMTEQE